MVNPTDGGKTTAAQQRMVTGIALELDNLAFSGRHLMYEVMARILKDKSIVLTPVLFSRFILRPPMEKGLERLLAAVGKKKLSADNLAQNIQKQFNCHLEKTSVRLNPVLASLLAAAAKAKVQIGALSFLPPAIVAELLDRFGLKESLVLHVMEGNSKEHFTSDGWLKLAKAMRLSPRCCLALTTSAASCKTALVAGMRCVVLPDAYTVHHDFSGADMVAEDIKELRLKDLMALLHPCSFR